MKLCRYGLSASVYAHIKHQNGEELGDFDRGVVVGVRQAGLSI